MTVHEVEDVPTVTHDRWLSKHRLSQGISSLSQGIESQASRASASSQPLKR